MTVPTTVNTMDRELAESLSRSYCAALSLLGNATQAEAVVLGAIESLKAEEITATGLTRAVIGRLVQTQLAVL